MSNGELRQKFLADAIQHYLDKTADDSLSVLEQATCKARYKSCEKSPYLVYILKPTSGDEYLEVKLIQNYSNEYTEDVGMITINSRQIVTFRRKGLDFHVEHEVDARGGLITLDLPIMNIRKVSQQESTLFLKCFEKIEKVINTNLSWCLTE